MSNLILNIRFIYWHLQIGPDWPWVAICFNRYRWELRAWRPFLQIN